MAIKVQRSFNMLISPIYCLTIALGSAKNITTTGKYWKTMKVIRGDLAV